MSQVLERPHKGLIRALEGLMSQFQLWLEVLPLCGDRRDGALAGPRVCAHFRIIFGSHFQNRSFLSSFVGFFFEAS